LTLENATYNTGLNGATGGQFLDILPPDLSLPTLCEVIHKKTVSLFEISFVSGWLFGGGDMSSLPWIKKAASHFGMAFQLADDIQDLHQDAFNERFVNMAAVMGTETTEKMMQNEIEGYKQVLNELKIDFSDLLEVIDLI
jgi:geranylgeranyl diphosphate synthase type II